MFFEHDLVVDHFLDSYLDFERSHDALDRLTSGMTSFFPGEWAIVGGAVRDVFLGETPNDVDIMLDVEEESLERVLKSFDYERNDFGGFKIRDSMDIDVWTVEGMWAVREGLVRNEGLVETYTGCAPYNFDCAVVFPDDRTGDVEGFVNAFDSGRLKLNSTHHPDRVATAVRAYRLSRRYNLELGVGVLDFVESVNSTFRGDG